MINSPSIGAERLSKMLRQPYDLYKGGYCDQYISGLMNQVSQAMDPSMSQEVSYVIRIYNMSNSFRFTCT